MWRPLLSTHSPQAFLKVLHHSLQHVGRICCHYFPDVLFQIHRCPWFLFVHLALEISSEEEVLRLGTLVPMNIKVPTKYPLSQDRIVVFEICLHSKSPMLYRQRSMATQMLWVSLEERSRTNSPRQRFHLQPFCKIVMYFWRTLYKTTYKRDANHSNISTFLSDMFRPHYRIINELRKFSNGRYPRWICQICKLTKPVTCG